MNDPVFAQSFWYASAPAAPVTHALEGEVTADVAIIGAGYTGLSRALHLAGKSGQPAIPSEQGNTSFRTEMERFRGASSDSIAGFAYSRAAGGGVKKKSPPVSVLNSTGTCAPFDSSTTASRTRLNTCSRGKPGARMYCARYFA